MNWISNVVRPKIRNYFARRETPENLWIKCPETGQLVFYKDVEANQFVIPGSNYHMRMGAKARLKSIFDNETWIAIAIPEVPLDPLRIRDERRYTERLKDARGQSGTNDATKLGLGRRGRLPDGAQRAEYLRENGMVDMVVPRKELRPTLANLCRLLTRARPNPAADAAEAAVPAGA